MHGLITTWAYYEHTNTSPEILNFQNYFVVPKIESVDLKKMTTILKIKKEQGTGGSQTSEPEKAHSTGEFVIVVKFGCHVLRRLAASLSIVIRQAGKQANKNSSLGGFFGIQHLAFSYYLAVLIVTIGFGSAKTTV